jgi:hypothetical protein
VRMSVILTAIACLLGVTGLSHAEQIAGPAIYGAFTQNVAQCTIVNTGSISVLVQARIFNESGNPLTESRIIQ